MEVAWDDSPVTAKDVLEAVGESRNWKLQTIKTLIGRLVKKGVLSFEQKGNRYFYSPEIGRDVAIAAETRTFLDRISEGSIAPLFAHLVEFRKELSAEEIDSLRKLLETESASKPEGESNS